MKRKMKEATFIPARIILALVMTFATLTASAYDFVADGIFYNILSEENLTCEVTNIGEKDESGELIPTYSGDIVIPSTVTNGGKTYTVTSIGQKAFYGCTSLTSIKLPTTVTDIEGAFIICSSLTKVELPNSVTKIKGGAFWHCESLKSLTIPGSVTEIGKYAILRCKNLKEIVSLAVTPPSIKEDSFFEVNKDELTVKVPAGSVEAYKAADGWKDFPNIVALTN